ncbi:uncharacterized protein [Antedon mediterranea]|uniref:uncharacterized protein n=1 Tax=Antedon mediterranea TaxID=105859 RepID=UPI003AF74066
MYSQSGNHNQPAEVFRKDLISAMKLPDSAHLDHDEYFLMADTWKPEWEKGVQVPVNPDRVPCADIKEVRPKTPGVYKIPRKLVKLPPKGNDDEDDKDKGFWQSLEAVCKYDLDDTDRIWLELANNEREEYGYPPIDEYTVERIIEECETQCHSNIEHAIQTEEGLGIEYDEDVICDVCRAPDCEEGNEMVFCDKCDVCVHQACYGIINVPEGTWMCRTCALGIQPACLLCGKKGGVMKSTRSGTKWSHVSCALWVPEVSIGCVDRMEPVTKISQIPASRWALVCNLCRVRTGACIQCSVKTCKTAYHVTCGFENSLEMKTFLDEDSEVRFKSFCLKHCSKKPDVDSPRKQGMAKKEKTQEEKANDRVIRIQRIMEEFYDYAESESVAESLGMKDDIDTIDLLLQYWKLKRRANFNKPLISFRKEDETPSENEEYNLTARLKMFVHLRQDLERVRNLCYMVQKREKLSKQYLKLKHQIFKKQCEVFNSDTTDLTEEELNLFVNADSLSSKERVNERLDRMVKCQSASDDDDTSDVNSPKMCHKSLENGASRNRHNTQRSVGHSDADVSDLESEEEKHSTNEMFSANRDLDIETDKQDICRSHNADTKNRVKRFKRTVNGRFGKSSQKVCRNEKNSDSVFDDTKEEIAPECRNGVDVTTRHKSTDALREIDAKENHGVCKGKRLSGKRRVVNVEKENDESLSETEILRRTKHNDTSIDQSEQLYIDNSDSNLSSDLRTLSLGKRRNQKNQKSRTKEWIEDMSDDSLSNFEDLKKSNENDHVKNFNRLRCDSDDSVSESDQKPKRNRRRSKQMSGNHKIVKNKSFANESDDNSVPVHVEEKNKIIPDKQMQSKNSTVDQNDCVAKNQNIDTKNIDTNCTNSRLTVRTKAMRKILPPRVKNLVNKLKESASKKNDIKSKLLSGKVHENDVAHDSNDTAVNRTRNTRKGVRSRTDSSSKEESNVPTISKEVKPIKGSDEAITTSTRNSRKCVRERVELPSKEKSNGPTRERINSEIKSERESDESVNLYSQESNRKRTDSVSEVKSRFSANNDSIEVDIRADRDSDDSIRLTRQTCFQAKVPLETSKSDKQIEKKSEGASDEFGPHPTKHPRKMLISQVDLSLDSNMPLTINKDLNSEVISVKQVEESNCQLTSSRHLRKKNVHTTNKTFLQVDSSTNKDTDIDTKSNFENDKKEAVNPRLSRNLRKQDTKSELEAKVVSNHIGNENVGSTENVLSNSPGNITHCNTKEYSMNVEVNHFEQRQGSVTKTCKALPKKPKRRRVSNSSTTNTSHSETKFPPRRSKRTVVKNDLEASTDLQHLSNEIDMKNSVILDPVILVEEPIDGLQELPNSVQVLNSASDTTINESSGYVASPQQNVHLELDDESSSGESHFGIRKTITDFLAHGDSSSAAESNIKTNVAPRQAKRLTRSVRNAFVKQVPPKESRSSTESEDDTKTVQKLAVPPPPLIRLEQVQNEVIKKEIENLPSPKKEELPVTPFLTQVENIATTQSPTKDEQIPSDVVPLKEQNELVAPCPVKEENSSPVLHHGNEVASSSSDSDSNGSSVDSDSGQSSSSSSSSSSQKSNSSQNSSSSSSDSSESFHTCDSGSEHANSDKEQPDQEVAKRKGLRRSTRVQTQQQQQQQQEQAKEINAITSNASEDPYHEDHIDAELDAVPSSPIIDKTIRKRVPEGIKRKESQTANPNAFAKKPRRNGIINDKKIDSYFKPISKTVDKDKNEAIPKLIIRIPECIQKSPTKLKIRVPTSPYSSYNSPYRGDDHVLKKRIKTNHVNNTDVDNFRIKGLNAYVTNATSVVSSPETRGARRRIDLELNSKSVDREFENVDNEISICRSSREPSPVSDSPQKPLTERLVLRRTTGNNYQVSQGSQR